MSVVSERDDVEAKLARGEFFWLDICPPGPDDYALLRDVFQFHPLAVEDSEHFGQRAKLEEYDDFVFLVVFGAAPDEDRLVEVHCFYSERFLVTVRRDEAPAFTELRSRFEHGLDPGRPIEVLYRVLDGLVDSFFPVLADFDEPVEAIQAMEAEQRVEHLSDLHRIRRQLVIVRRAVVPERDLLAKLLVGRVTLPGMTADDEHYFRNVYDHLISLAEQIDGHRDLISGAMDLYQTIASNRLNEVIKKLTVIATIFLPLTFITGFFGQNFPWLVEHIGGPGWFFVLGFGLDLLAVAGMLAFFRRRGWF